jgi:hypothetical protein
VKKSRDLQFPANNSPSQLIADEPRLGRADPPPNHFTEVNFMANAIVNNEERDNRVQELCAALKKDTGLSNRTVKTSKAGLISKGWLGYTGDYKEPRHAEGTYAVSVMESGSRGGPIGRR